MTFEIAEPVWRPPQTRAQIKAEAEARFRARVIELGGKPAFDSWQGAGHPHHVVCKNGHDSWPFPSSVRRGRGLCSKCITYEAEHSFRYRVIQLGGTPNFEVWKGTHKPHHIVCANGHHTQVHPTSIQQGYGLCIKCAGQDPMESEHKFRKRVIELGGTPDYSYWKGASKPLHVICENSHHAYPTPKHVIAGGGICRLCSHKEWDVFYVVTSHNTVKLGITSGDARPRLSRHRSDGYGSVVFIATNLEARELETQLLEYLTSAGFSPVRGNEYFSIDALPVILSELDAYGLTNEVTA